MKYVPHDYQQFVIDYIISHPTAAVFLDMGLGKTSISLTALWELLFELFDVANLKRIFRMAKDFPYFLLFFKDF